MTVATAAGLVVIAALAVVGWLLLRRLRRSEGERAHLADQLDRRLSELFSLQELSYVLSESLQLARITDQVTSYVMRFLDTSGAAIALTDDVGPGLTVTAAAGTLADLRGRRITDDDPGVMLEALGTERVRVADRSGGDSPELVAGVRVAQAAVAPMRAHGVTVGALAIVDPRQATFGIEDVRLLSTVATHTAVVLANARFFELIRRSKEEWETAFDAITEGIAVVDADARIRRANRALAQMADCEIPALLGERVEAVLSDDSGAVAELLAAVRRGGRRPPLMLPIKPARTLRIMAAPMMRGESGSAVVLLVEDVTEQQALEAQMIQSEKLAAVGQLVSGVAHEINNPLTSIAGLAELLLEQLDTPAATRPHLAVIQEQAERASRIVQNLLTFARVGPPETKPVSLNDLAQRTLLLMEREMETRGIRLERKLATSPPLALADAHQLQQVLVNLLTNAAQALDGVPAGRPRRIAVETIAGDDTVALRVSDTGPGIPADVVDHIFTPFFTTKEPGTGTGLGLSISYRIVAAHSGSLALDQTGGWTTFTLTLPRVARSPAPDGRAQDAAATPPSSSRHRILLIDDDPAVRRLATAFFVREGHEIRAVPASLGLEAAAGASYDLIVVDGRAALPSSGQPLVRALLDGLPAARDRLLVAIEERRGSSAEPFRSVGAGWVRKPFNLRDLRTAARRIWGEGG